MSLIKLFELMFLAILLVLFSSGCATEMYINGTKEISAPRFNKNSSYVVFPRSAGFGGGYLLSAHIIEFDLTKNSTKLVGAIDAGKKLVYETSPGIKYFYVSKAYRNSGVENLLTLGLTDIFLSVAKGRILKAELEAGKKYYYNELQSLEPFEPLNTVDKSKIDTIEKLPTLIPNDKALATYNENVDKFIVEIKEILQDSDKMSTIERDMMKKEYGFPLD